MNNRVLIDKASLSGVRKAIRADLRGKGIDPSAAFDCLVAVTEACTNALLHAPGTDGDRPTVSWEIEGGEVCFTIEDFSAAGWAAGLHEAERDGGFGIPLMKGLMDEVDIDARPAGTRVVMVKRLKA